ncbi:MAG: hypothetical protein JXR96_12860 [Deltaproteobacteria bacterium]|nr:hypothetical protein [Deltaproteobacteria bacterium]
MVGEEDGEDIYYCPCTTGCSCADEPPSDGYDVWGCHWARDYYYYGPATSLWPAGYCDCVKHVPCWARCCGLRDESGALSCRLDGGVQECRSEPEYLEEDPPARFMSCEQGLITMGGMKWLLADGGMADGWCR